MDPPTGVSDDEKRKIDKKHEAKFRRLVKKMREEPDWKEPRYILDAADNPVLQAMNKVFEKQARRKIN